jgi:hypothetical protein
MTLTLPDVDELGTGTDKSIAIFLTGALNLVDAAFVADTDFDVLGTGTDKSIAIFLPGALVDAAVVADTDFELGSSRSETDDALSPQKS